MKSERGSFPTTFDLLEGGTNASFLEGTIGFLSYQRIWLPAVVGLGLSAVVLFFVLQSSSALRFAGGTTALVAMVLVLPAIFRGFAASAFGTVIVRTPL